MMKKQKVFILGLKKIGERVMDLPLSVVIQHSHQIWNSSSSVQYRWSEHPQTSELIAGSVSMQSCIKGFQESCLVFCMEHSQSSVSMDDFDPDNYFCLWAWWWHRNLLFRRSVMHSHVLGLLPHPPAPHCSAEENLLGCWKQCSCFCRVELQWSYKKCFVTSSRQHHWHNIAYNNLALPGSRECLFLQLKEHSTLVPMGII